MSTQKNFRFETLQLHVGQEKADPATDARAVPIYQTTSYVFHDSQHAADRFGLRDAGNIYGRLTNSTQGVFEDRVAALEGGVAGLAVASGAAAITYALQNILGAGDHIVAADNLYGGSYNLITHTLATQGISNTIVRVNDTEALEKAIQPNTKVVFAETFGNPNSDVLDIEAVAEVAHRHNIPLIIDNTFGTPYLIRPLEHGADIVVHSATKFLGGHGTSLGGDDGIAVAYMLAVLDDPSIVHPALECIFTVDEEVGMMGAEVLDPSLIRGRRMLNLDSEEEGILTAGCAGGTHQVLILGGKRNERKGLVLRLGVSGLLGGHSGEMPGRGRANANIILARALFKLYQLHPFRLMQINGGTKDNAIPREAQASLLFSGDVDRKEISEAVQALHETIHAEYQVTDPGLTIASSWEEGNPKEKKTVFIKRDTRRFIRFLMSVPDGLIEYMPGFDRMPQTSLNMGILKTAADGIEATFLVRSALNSQREMMNDRLQCIAAQFDGKVNVKGSYPAWEYRPQSAFRDMLADLYEKTTGKKPVVFVTHGGLECGLLSDKLPGLDCVSIGPKMYGIHTPQEKLHIASTGATWTYLKAALRACAEN